MTTAYEVHEYWVTHEPTGTYANFVATVSDMMMCVPASRFGPEQWCDARCTGHILLADDETPPSATDSIAVFDLANAVTNWELEDPTLDY